MPPNLHTALPIHRGNMTPLRDLKLRCKPCAATGGYLALYIPLDIQEPKDFLAGQICLSGRSGSKLADHTMAEARQGRQVRRPLLARQQLHRELRNGKEQKKQRAYDKSNPFGVTSTDCNTGCEPSGPKHRGDNHGNNDEPPKTNIARHARTSRS